MRYTKSIKVLQHTATMIFVVLFAVNIVLPVKKDDVINANVFTFATLLLWTVTVLSANGYLKKVDYVHDGKVVYRTFLPVFQVAIVRAIEIGYYFIREREQFRPKVFWIDVVFDVLFVIVLLLDKSRYYYEAVESEDKNEKY